MLNHLLQSQPDTLISTCVQDGHMGDKLKPHHVAVCTLLRAEVSIVWSMI